MIPLLVIVGPTAIGKSRIALTLSQELKGEIVSVDSRKVYKYMDIGTAKPTAEERKKIPHHLLDLIEPDEEFSAGRFREEASKIISQIHNRGNLPVLEGGSGLYLRTVIDGIFSGPSADAGIRKKLKEEAEKSGTIYLHKKLEQVDPLTASRVHPNDLVRIIRALEVCETTGEPISKLRLSERNVNDKLYTSNIIGLNRPRAELYRRIEERAEVMFAEGLVDEVEGLLSRGYDENLVSMQGLGYKEVCGYLAGRYDEKEAMRLLKRNTRRYAKRQLTWFRKDNRVHWIDMEENEDNKKTSKKIKNFLANCGEGE